MKLLYAQRDNETTGSQISLEFHGGFIIGILERVMGTELEDLTEVFVVVRTRWPRIIVLA